MKKFLTDSLFTTAAFTIQKPFAFVREFILAGILGPYYFGLRNLIVMLTNYSAYSDLGVTQELYRQNGKTKEGITYLPTAITYSLIISLIIAIGIIGFTLLTNYSLEVDVSFYILILICSFFLVGNVINYYLMGRAEFRKTTITETIYVITNTLLTILLAYYYGYLGAILGILIAMFIRFILFYKEFLKLKIKIQFEYDKFIFLLKNGINLFINNISSTVYFQVDSLIAVIMLGPAALGIYNLAATLGYFTNTIFTSTIGPLGQRMLEKSEDSIIKNYLHAVTTLAGYTMIFPILLIVFITPIILNLYLPLYTEAIILVGILAPAAYFNIILGPINNYLIAKSKERTITISTLIAILINVILNVYFIMLGYGLMGIAISTSISYAVNFILLHYLSKTVTLKQFISELFPLFYMILFIYNFTYGFILLPVYLILTYYVFTRRGVNEYLIKIINILLKNN